MKNAILFLLTCLIAIVCKAQQVEIATHDMLPPYIYTDEKGKLTGIYIDIVNKAVARMPNYQVTYKVLPWARAKMEVEKGITFALLPPYFHAHDWHTMTEPKRPYIWPYSLPLHIQRDVVVCNEKVLSTARVKFPDDYHGLKFVMSRGDGRSGEEFAQLVKQQKIEVLLINDAKSIVPSLLTEMADCTVISQLPFAWHVKQLKENGLYQSYDKKAVVLKELAVISNNSGHLGYTDINAEKNFPFKKDFTIKFDIEIYKMKRSGEIEQIIKRYVN
ncbi:ABC transporter substrate-binding protein [Thalassotalea insulae]|uniref:ABC transporter substrate-binding protein n=1 Tax=Thalassotalea insulae TaxID=2056778 RepID=A0ABQ6GSB9_9GAMM|nr:transporter substrate-binding domain-containing protein [Thalassotalea insulae]GLX78229.1 ABC transporter substrate-binding protein [Thalassotalea insulae]